MSTSTLTLTVRLPNWVGDVVMALPALQAIQQCGVEVQLFGKAWVSDLLGINALPHISVINGFWQSTKSLRDIARSDKILLFTNSFSSAMMAKLAGKAPIGYTTDARQFLLKAGLAKRSSQHEVEYFWDLARFAMQYWFPELHWPEHMPSKIHLSLNPVAIASATIALKRANIEAPFWVLCPFAHGTGNHGQEKIWPHWRELSQRLQHQLVVCPGKNEEHLCADLVPKATVLTGLNLSEYAAVLARAENVIANDSGPMHIAAAVGVNTLGIFGVSDPRRTAPWGANYIGEQDQWPALADVLNYIEENV